MRRKRERRRKIKGGDTQNTRALVVRMLLCCNLSLPSRVYFFSVAVTRRASDAAMHSCARWADTVNSFCPFFFPNKSDQRGTGAPAECSELMNSVAGLHERSQIFEPPHRPPSLSCHLLHLDHSCSSKDKTDMFADYFLRCPDLIRLFQMSPRVDARPPLVPLTDGSIRRQPTMSPKLLNICKTFVPLMTN